MKKLIEIHADENFFMARLTIPQAAPSKCALLLAGTWASYGGFYMTFSCPWGQVSYTIPHVYRGILRFNVWKMRKQLNRFLMYFKRGPVYADWSAYYRVDHVSDRGCIKFSNGREAVRWAKAQDEDYDTEVSFGYEWSDAESYAEYRRAVDAEKDTGYRVLSRDHLMEAHEDGHPHHVYC